MGTYRRDGRVSVRDGIVSKMQRIMRPQIRHMVFVVVVVVGPGLGFLIFAI
jgi:hypothetical protein